MRFEQFSAASTMQEGPIVPCPFKRILVAVDVGAMANSVAATAEGLAKRLRADVVLVNVCCGRSLTSPELGYLTPEVHEAYVQTGTHLLSTLKADVFGSANVRTALLEGDAAIEIVKAAKTFHADLIVVGTHNRGRIAQVVLGSVAHAVIHKAPCPVVTVAVPTPEHRSTSQTNQAASQA